MLVHINHDEYDKCWSIEPSREIPYYSKKKMKMNYPKGGYIVMGAFGKGIDETSNTFVHEEVRISYSTLHFNKLRYAIDGYFDCGNDQYIAVVKEAKMRNMAVLITLLLSITLVLFAMGNMPKNALDSNAKTYTPNIEVAIETDPNHIALPGYDDVRMEAGSNVAYLALWNPDENPCLFKFTLIKDGTILYESGLIEPGKAVTEVQLNESIPKGVHEAVLKIQTYAIDDTSIELNGGEVLIKLVGLEKES